MPRKKSPGLLPDKPQGNRSLNLHIRLTEYDAGMLHAACAHAGQSVSNYVRWLIHEGAKHTLAGPSKAEQVKALEKHLHSLLPPLEQLPPPKPLPSPPKHVDVRPAPLYWEGPKAAQKAAATPPAPVPPPPALSDLLPLTAATAAPPAKPPAPAEELPEWFRLRPDDPRPAELPDDMSDWT